MKTRNRRYPRSSGMDGDKSGESGAFLFSRRVPDFCDGRRSFPANENSNLYRRARRQINMASLENLGQIVRKIGNERRNSLPFFKVMRKRKTKNEKQNSNLFFNVT